MSEHSRQLIEKVLTHTYDVKEYLSKDSDDYIEAWVNVMRTFDHRNEISAKRRLEAYEKGLLLMFENWVFKTVIIERMSGTDKLNNEGKKWAKEEDEELVNLAAMCYEEFGKYDPVYMIAPSIFERSSQAIRTRLSQLIGIERLTVKVEGKFEGDFEGESVRGLISGLVHKK